MESYRKFLRPEVIAKLGRIDFKARLVVEGFLSGLHRSPYKGFSAEFSEYRPYMPGDSIKRVDWKVYAKTDKFFVKEYEEETNLKAYLVLDSSGSMGYTSNTITKLEYASYLAASLAYLLLRQKDSAGLVVFTSGIETYIPPRGSSAHLYNILKEIDGVKPGKDTDLAATFHDLASRIKRRGLIIIFSDLFDNEEAVLKALHHFRHKKHEVLVFHILDKNELNFSFHNPLILKDMESSKEMTVDPRILRKEYQKGIKDFLRDFKRKCQERLIDYYLITTDTPLDNALLSYLAKRSRLG